MLAKRKIVQILIRLLLSELLLEQSDLGMYCFLKQNYFCPSIQGNYDRYSLDKVTIYRQLILIEPNINKIIRLVPGFTGQLFSQ